MKGSKKLVDIIWDHNEEALLADGFDDAIIGMVEDFHHTPVVLYDKALSSGIGEPGGPEYPD